MCGCRLDEWVWIGTGGALAGYFLLEVVMGAWDRAEDAKAVPWWIKAPLVIATLGIACAVPSWLKNSGPNVPPHEEFTGIDGSENQRAGVRGAGARDAGGN